MTNPTYDRIDSLDLIRGIAILAIPIMNIYSMALPPVAYFVPTWTAGSGSVDMAVYVFQVLFVESRFMSIFTMLFGVGLVAVAQIPMALLVWGSIATGENLMDVPPLPFDAAALAAAQTEWTTLPARLGANAGEFLTALAAGPIVLFWHTAGVMLIGMALYRRGFFTDNGAWRRGVASLVLGFTIGAAVLAGRFAVGLETSAAQGLFGAVTLAGISMGIGYMSLLIPLASGNGLLVRALRNTGKTAFTLYISQTVVSLVLFSFILRPLWGNWGRLPLLVYVLLFAVVQVMFAHWWQTHRGMGPLEAMWRRFATVTSTP